VFDDKPATEEESNEDAEIDKHDVWPATETRLPHGSLSLQSRNNNERDIKATDEGPSQNPDPRVFRQVLTGGT